MKKYIFWALGAGFIFLGFSAYMQSLPEKKNDRIYTEFKKYSPYYIDKRFGGLRILNKEDEEFKEKPDNIKVFHRLDELDKAWGKSHLKLTNSELLVLDNNGTTQATIVLKTDAELQFIHTFFGIK
jgi:hypothetical protein